MTGKLGSRFNIKMPLTSIKCGDSHYRDKTAVIIELTHLTNPIMHGKYPTMHHFVTEMCTRVHISVTKWCIVGYEIGALWDWCNRSIGPWSMMMSWHENVFRIREPLWENPRLVGGFPHSGPVMSNVMFSLLWARTSCWTNSRVLGVLRRHGVSRTRYPFQEVYHGECP